MTTTFAGLAVVAVLIWNASQFFSEFRAEQKNGFATMQREITAIRGEVSEVKAHAWTVEQQIRWAYDFDRLNREKNLQVPLPAGLPDVSIVK